MTGGGRDGEDDLTNIGYKSIQNFHNKFMPYNKYIQIKILKS
jgi:hypothetical protein